MSKLKSNKQLINTRYHKNIYRKILLIIAKIQQKSVLIDMCGMCSIIIPRVSSVVLYDKSKKLYHQRVVVIFLLCFFFSFRPALILIKGNFDECRFLFFWDGKEKVWRSTDCIHHTHSRTTHPFVTLLTFA